MAERPFEFRGYVRFTRVGLAYLTATLLVGFAALNTGNNSLYIALSFMLGALILSGVASQRGLRNIEVQFVQLGETWAGRPARGWLRISTRSRFLNVRDLILTSPQLYKPAFIPIVQRRSETTIEVTFLFEHRGLTSLSSVDLYARYPFGFFLKKRIARVKGETIVYPHLLEAASTSRLSESVEGEIHPVEKPGSGTELHGFREYVRGDSLRQLHWRKTASLGRWIIKQNEAESGRTLTVVVDTFVPSRNAEEEFERMISTATTLIHDALERQFGVVLITPGVTLSSEASNGRRAIFERLALMAGTRERELFPAIPTGAAVFSLRRGDELKTA